MNPSQFSQRKFFGARSDESISGLQMNHLAAVDFFIGENAGLSNITITEKRRKMFKLEEVTGQVK